MKKMAFVFFLLFISFKLSAQQYLGHGRQFIRGKIHVTGSGTTQSNYPYITGTNNLGMVIYFFNASDICNYSKLTTAETIGARLAEFYTAHYKHPSSGLWEYTDEFNNTIYISERASENNRVIFNYSYQRPN